MSEERKPSLGRGAARPKAERGAEAGVSVEPQQILEHCARWISESDETRQGAWTERVL